MYTIFVWTKNENQKINYWSKIKIKPKIQLNFQTPSGAISEDIKLKSDFCYSDSIHFIYQGK